MSEAPDDPSVLSIAVSISTGTQVDWDQLRHEAATAEDVELLGELQVLEGIARFHRHEGQPETTNPTDRLEPAETRSWSHFTILEEVGAGAFGAVYLATDTKLEREVALKLLHLGGPESPTNPSRVLKEARLLARVRHRNVVAIYGADHLDNRVGIWMEFVRGRTLEELLRTHGPFGAREAALVGLDLCRALAAVHGAGLIHGDVKAHNVMREEGGRTVLMDFGTGKDLDADRWVERLRLQDVAGTPLYLAPEVFAGKPRSKATDIYSLGVLLYHLVTMAYPVDGVTGEAVVQAHGRGERVHLRDLRPELPDDFVRMIERAIAADPSERFGSVGAFEAELARFLGAAAEVSDSRDSRSGRVTAMTIAFLLLFAGGYWIATRQRLSNADHPGGTTSTSPQPSSASLAGSYTIDAGLYRVQGVGEQRLQPGATVRPGDRLALEVRVSTPTHIYVVNEDDRGESYLLFPLPGQKVTNPLPAVQPNRLPGERDGQQVYWQVTSAGGREHFLIFASPEPVIAFEKMFATLPRPELNAPVVSAKLSRDAVGLLRGVGGLAPASARPTDGLRLTDQFTTPLGESEETARGIWVRQITLANPAR
jgi:eukaryotic-like serine/threonine-protein kinase